MQPILGSGREEGGRVGWVYRKKEVEKRNTAEQWNTVKAIARMVHTT